MNNIIVIILFILVIILFINDITQLFSFKEGAGDLQLVINKAQDPKQSPLPEQQCKAVTNLFVNFTTNANGESYFNWDDVPSGATTNNISEDDCNSCTDKLRWNNGECIKI